MIKNYTIGILVGYIFVNAPFWEWEENTLAQGFLLLIVMLCVAWIIRLTEIDIAKTKRRQIRRNMTKTHIYIVREMGEDK